LPIAQNENRFGDGGNGSKLYDYDYRGSGHSGYGCVHHDAELTMIRICLIRMQVSYLGNRQRGQQNEAQPRDRNHRVAARA
jgi:hypothetical protein